MFGTAKTGFIEQFAHLITNGIIIVLKPLVSKQPHTRLARLARNGHDDRFARSLRIASAKRHQSLAA